MQCGVLVIVLVSRLFWLKLMQFGGVLISCDMVCCFMYLDMLKCISFMFKVFVNCCVILVLFMLVGLVKRNELIGLFGVLSLVWDSLIVVDSDLMVLFWLNMVSLRLCLRLCSNFLLEVVMCFGGICVIFVMIFLICVISMCFMCFFFGCRCWQVFVLLMMLMVLFGMCWLLMQCVVSLVVVCSVLLLYLMW